MTSSSSGNIHSHGEIYLRLYDPIKENMVWYRSLLNSSHIVREEGVGEDNYDMHSKQQKIIKELHKFIEGEPGYTSMLLNNYMACAGVSPYIYICGSPGRGSKDVWRINTSLRDSKWENCPSLNIERRNPLPFVIGKSLFLVGSVSPLYRTAYVSSLPLGEVLEDASAENLQDWVSMPYPPHVPFKEPSFCAAHREINKFIYVTSQYPTRICAYDFDEKSWGSSTEVNRLIFEKGKAFVVEESFVWWDRGSICVSDLTLSTFSKSSCASFGLIGVECAPLFEANHLSNAQFLHLGGRSFLLIWKRDSKFNFVELSVYPFTDIRGQIELEVSISSKYEIEDSELHSFGLIDAVVM